MIRTAEIASWKKDECTGWYRYRLTCGDIYYARSGDWPDTSWKDPLPAGTPVHCTAH